MNGLLFRSYTAADKEVCLEIFMSNTPRYFGVEERDDFQHFLETLPCAYFVVSQHNRVVACGGYGRDNARQTIVLAWGMVHVDLHKQKIGSYLLVERIKQIHKDFGSVTVNIDTSQHSKGFFERYGFIATGFTENYYAPGIHRVDMELKLDNNSQQAIIKQGIQNQ